ncbi:MAG TPA: pyridoxamine 5'-phosphate oxidase family protein [Ktedonobacterales bacterium]
MGSHDEPRGAEPAPAPEDPEGARGWEAHAGGAPRASRPRAPAPYAFSGPGAGQLPWSHAVERLERARYYWLATTRPDGRPHVTPLWGAWVDGALYLDGHPSSRWARNLSANPAASVHLESGDDVLIVEGVVADVTVEPLLGQRIVAAWIAKYQRLAPKPSDDGIFRLRPRAARGWSTESLTDGTRWEFDDAT